MYSIYYFVLITFKTQTRCTNIRENMASAPFNLDLFVRFLISYFILGVEIKQLQILSSELLARSKRKLIIHWRVWASPAF